jgi:hypothetical protein
LSLFARVGPLQCRFDAIGQRIRALGGEFLACCSHVAGCDEIVDLVSKSGDFSDAYCPIVDVVTGGNTGEADLDGPMVERIE